MQTLIKGAALAALATVAIAGSANAAVTITNVVGNVLPAGFVMVDNFDSAIKSGYTLTGTASIVSGSNSQHAQPAGDNTKYLAIEDHESATFYSAAGFTSFSFYVGSPDDYNKVRLWDGTMDVNYSGSAMMGNPFQLDNGNKNAGYTVTYNLNGGLVHRITFSSTQDAFEIDNFAVKGAGGSAVPEPATWAMMITGFGMAGVALRRRRQVAVAA